MVVLKKKQLSQKCDALGLGDCVFCLKINLISKIKNTRTPNINNNNCQWTLSAQFRTVVVSLSDFVHIASEETITGIQVWA